MEILPDLLGLQLKKALAIVTLSVLLSIVADAQARPPAHKKQSADAASAPQQTVAPDDQPDAAADADDDDGAGPLPSIELSDELLFRLLRGELAEQRGDWRLAYTTMMATAEETRDPRLAREAAEIALRAAKIDDALSAVNLWRDIAPHSDQASQFYLGVVLLDDDFAAAKPVLLQRLQEVKPQARGLLIMQIQRLLSRAKDQAGAFALLEDLAGPYQNMYETHLALSQGAYAKGDVARAHDEAQIALTMKPDLEIAALMLAQSAPNRNDAMDELKSFLEANPSAHDARVAYAKLLLDNKQPDLARAQLDILLKANPHDLPILYAMGVLCMQTNDLPAAEQYLTTYLQTLRADNDETRDPAQALLLLAQIAVVRKDYPAALHWLAQIDAGPAYFSAQIQSALIMAQTGDVEGARNLLHNLNPDGEEHQVQVITAEAQILRDADRMPEAMAVMKKGVRRFPKNVGLLYDYAMMAERAGRYGLMETELRKIIKLAPKNQDAYNALGYSLADRGIRLKEAQTLIAKALKLAPDNPFILDSMGWVQFRLGNLQEAETYLRRAYALRPDVEIGAHLGEVLWTMGKKESAEKYWREAHQKDPQNDTLNSTLTRLHVNL